MRLTTPLTNKDILQLEMGDKVLLDGFIYTARDKTHQRIVKVLKSGKKLPFELKGQVIFYAGPTPPRQRRGWRGKTVGAIGPTTAARLDPYTPFLLKEGLKGMVGKGARSKEVKEAIKENKAVYFVAVGGAAAYLSQFVVSSQVLAHRDLGPEAIYKLEVKDFPLVVAIDAQGHDLFLEGPRRYSR